MNKIDGVAPVLLNEEDFIYKIENLNKDLIPGEMWMNDKCEMQVKSRKIVRWIKCILSIILPINLFSSIKASRVALAYFELVKKHQEHLKNPETVKKTKQVLKTLNEKTLEKYERKITALLYAIDGLSALQ